DEVRDIIDKKIGAHLSLDPVAAAAAIVRVANDKMAGAIRLVSLQRGRDPRDFVLFAFGGARPLHALALARELATPTVLVPRVPGSRRRSVAWWPSCVTTSCGPSTRDCCAGT